MPYLPWKGVWIMDTNTLTLTELSDIILTQMEKSGFMESTRGTYVSLFHRLCRMAEERGDEYYTIELGQAFMNDQSHIIPKNTERYHHDRTASYKRCIKFIESYLTTGTVDWSPALHCASFPVSSERLKEAFSAFTRAMNEKELKPNTIDGYRRFVYYFVEFLEGNFYCTGSKSWMPSSSALPIIMTMSVFPMMRSFSILSTNLHSQEALTWSLTGRPSASSDRQAAGSRVLSTTSWQPLLPMAPRLPKAL